MCDEQQHTESERKKAKKKRSSLDLPVLLTLAVRSHELVDSFIVSPGSVRIRYLPLFLFYHAANPTVLTVLNVQRIMLS